MPTVPETEKDKIVDEPVGDGVSGFVAGFSQEVRGQVKNITRWVHQSLDDQIVGTTVKRCAKALRGALPRTPAASSPLSAPSPTPEERKRSDAEQAEMDALLLAKLEKRFEARLEARRERIAGRNALPAIVEPEADVGAPQPEQPVPVGDTTAAPRPVSPPASAAESPVSVPSPPDDLSSEEITASVADRREAIAETEKVPAGPYEYPPRELLREEPDAVVVEPEDIERRRRAIQDTLDDFGIDAEVGNAVVGPRVTLYEVTPARGVKVEAITAIANNLAMELAALSLRILAPVPGQDYVGIEVPNGQDATVRLGDLMADELWHETRARIPLLLGRNTHGSDVVLDLTRAPHLLVAGATGSGKSVCLNGILISLLYRFSPDELRLVLVDPKIVEFSIYNAVPHLLVPVITETKEVVFALQWVIREVERRYRVLAKVGARNLAGFNSRPPDPTPVYDDDGNLVPAKFPYIVVVIDELADIMMTARSDVENNLARIAQISRAVGVHTIVATQRPSVNVITGVIKANYPTRIAFQVSSQIDSRTIIDGKGAESLLGHGDMLFRPPGSGRLERLQGVLLEDEEIENVVRFVAERSGQDFDMSIVAPPRDDGDAVEFGEGLSEEEERLIQDAVETIVRDQRASTSYLQRRLRIGYNRAATIIDILEERGILGPQIGSAPREILVSSAEVDE